MSGLFLTMAILFEVSGTLMLKFSNGFKIILPGILFIIFYAISFYFLSIALKEIDIGIAYAIWCAVGMTLVAILGIVLFHEPVTLIKILSIIFIIIGTVGLKLSNSFS